MITNIDFQILDFIREHFSCGLMDFLMPKITFLGNAGFIWIIVAVGMGISNKYRKTGIALALSLLGSAIIGNLILKNLVERERPCWINDTVRMLIAVPHDYSFPSGHTMMSFAAAAVIMRNSKRFGVTAYILAFLIAFSRLYLYVHFPSDVIGGIIVGTAIGMISCFLCESKVIRRLGAKISRLQKRK